MAKSSPESPAQDGRGLEFVRPSALFRGNSLDKFDSPIKDTIAGSNLNPFKIKMQPPFSPSVTETVSKSCFPSPGHEHRVSKDQYGVSDEDTIITAADEGDDDIFGTSPAPSSPLRAFGSPSARKRTASIRKEEIRQTLDEKCFSPCTNHSLKYRSIASPMFSPPVVRKENILPTNFRPFRQGDIEPTRSFDSHDSTISAKSTNSTLSPLPQCNSHLGIGSEKGFPARVGQYSFTRSPIEELSYLESGSSYGEDDEDSLICVNKIRRLNLDYDRDECQSMDTDRQQNEERVKTNKFKNDEQNINFYSKHLHMHNLQENLISPKDVSSFCVTNINTHSPLASAFESPPVPRRKGVDSPTFPHSYEVRPTWKQETLMPTPALKRKACRSPYLSSRLSHDAIAERPTALREVTSRMMQDFETVGTLGSGSFGTVYKCISRLDGCPYAVKATKYQAKGKADRDRMLKEVYALAALSDLTDTAAFHIVGYHQAWMEENRLYIQTELCTSTLLEEIKTGGAISHDASRQFKVLREMLLALDLIHRNGMVHLDIKPENIFVKNDQFKLGDFGLVVQSSVHGDVEEGDSRYMCNDLLQGKHDDLTKCDIFSLGATMYEIALQRTLPTHGEEWHEIRAGKLSPLPHTSNELCNIIKVMIHPKREQRPSAAMLLKRRQLLSEDQKQLILARNKVREANMALAVKDARLKALSFPPRTPLTRANTLG